jgi:D-alanyl-D-alanine carboxypeptidase/D-alanyl-D-alanine-endopeptidase (penicillin-binding protein 4)
MYAGMKYLGDSLIAGYVLPQQDGSLLFRSNADPTLLHPDFSFQPLTETLKKYAVIKWTNATMRTSEYGNGWSWNDYDATYMAPRSSMPMWGNVANFSLQQGKLQVKPAVAASLISNAESFRDTTFSVVRKFNDPIFSLEKGRSKNITSTLFPSPDATIKLAAAYFGNKWINEPATGNQQLVTVFSQPTDSMLRPLMHRSDNFFAEQTLLMLSQQWFGYMDENAVIDSLMKTDLQSMPDKPRWVDGSGLSRYNLFSPADYVWLLQKAKTEFTMNRLQDIMPTGNDGTLTNYYKTLQGKIFAKTGTLAGVVALSGYLYAKSGKHLLFSVLVNNHNGAATAVRRAVEKYLLAVYEKY